MIYKTILDTLTRRDLQARERARAGEWSERDEHRAQTLRRLRAAHPFETGAATMLVGNSLLPRTRPDDDIAPVLAAMTPLPFDRVFFGFTVDGYKEWGGDHEWGAVLMEMMEDGLQASCLYGGPERIAYPNVWIRFRHDGTTIWAPGEGAGPGVEEDRIHEMARFIAGNTFDARAVLHLMSAKNAPVEGRAEPLRSRQERRALERAGQLPKGPPRTVTRILLNAQGRDHLAALEAEGTGDLIRRRAHWVRGHLLNTPTAGPVWRKAHVRGFGEIQDTTRVVTLAGDHDDSPAPA